MDLQGLKVCGLKLKGINDNNLTAIAGLEMSIDSQKEWIMNELGTPAKTISFEKYSGTSL